MQFSQYHKLACVLLAVGFVGCHTIYIARSQAPLVMPSVIAILCMCSLFIATSISAKTTLGLLNSVPLILATFLLYPLKLSFMLMASTMPALFTRNEVWVQDAEQNYPALLVLSVAINLVLLASILILSRTRGARIKVLRPHSTISGLNHRQLSVIVLMSIGLFVVMNYYRIGQMGYVGSQSLPYRISGIVFYVQLIVLPYLLLFNYVKWSQSGQRAKATFGLVALILHAIGLQLVTGSKGVLVAQAIALFLTRQAASLRTRSAFFVLLSLLLPTVAMYQVLHAGREIRLFEDKGIFESLTAAADSANSANTSQLTLADNIHVFYGRLTGIEALTGAMLNSRKEERLSANFAWLFLDPVRSPSLVITQDVFGYLDTGTQFAIGLPGLSYLVGGTPLLLGTLFLIPFTGLAIAIANRLCPTKSILAITVASITSWQIETVMDGDIDTAGLRLASRLVAIALCIHFERQWLKTPVS